MLGKLRRLITYDYVSPFDEEVCRDRLSRDYWEKAFRDKKKSVYFAAATSIVPLNHKKKGTILEASVGGGQLLSTEYNFQISVEKSIIGSVLHVKHNPLFFFAGLGGFIGFLGLLAFCSVIRGLIINDINDAIFAFGFFLVIVLILFGLEALARSAVTNFLDEILDAKRVKWSEDDPVIINDNPVCPSKRPSP